MPSTVEVKCKNKACPKPGGLFTARIADRKRGWGKFCSKSCKAVEQESRTHQSRNYYRRLEAAHKQGPMESGLDHIEIAKGAMEDGWDGHKNAF